jgi:hypothetical protein
MVGSWPQSFRNYRDSELASPRLVTSQDGVEKNVSCWFTQTTISSFLIGTSV